MERNPLVTIICLTWNHEKYIQQSLNSDLAQDYPNIEIIVIDNHSSDQTFLVAKSTLKDSKINYVLHQFDENIGIAPALNYAIKNLAKGDYICLNSGDDFLEANSISERMKYLKLNSQYKWVYSYGYYYFEDNEKKELIDTECRSEGFVFNSLLKENFINYNGIIFSKVIFEEIGYFDPELSIEDWDFSLRAIQKFPIGLVRKPLFYYRRHSSGYSSSNSIKYFEDCLKVIRKHSRYPESKIQSKRWNKLYIWKLYEEQKTWKSFFYILGYSFEDSAYFKTALSLLLTLLKIRA